MENTDKFDIDKINMNLAKSIKNITETCDKINADRVIALEDIPQEMERIMRNMEWNKICSIDRRIDQINEKQDMIIEKLGVHYGR